VESAPLTQNEWAGSGPVQKKFKNILRKFVISPRIFLLNFA